MKRSHYLEILSHDHFEGLLVAKRLSTGLGRSVDRATLAGYTKFVWNTKLAPHFRLEEVHLVPLVRAARIPELVDRVLSEHEQIRDLVAQAADARSSTQCFADLSELLKEHIRFEERDVFPALERASTDAELKTLCESLNADHATDAPEWNIRFWE
ncbi:MAG: hemerythrin domain-containing protein [Bacteroidetes bacterium]|nr:hemerythrin domain-containing protein [Bacteroidota bacterium]